MSESTKCPDCGRPRGSDAVDDDRMPPAYCWRDCGCYGNAVATRECFRAQLASTKERADEAERALAAERRCSTCGDDPAARPNGLPCVCGDGTRDGETRGLRFAAIGAEKALDAERAAHEEEKMQLLFDRDDAQRHFESAASAHDALLAEVADELAAHEQTRAQAAAMREAIEALTGCEHDTASIDDDAGIEECENCGAWRIFDDEDERVYRPRQWHAPKWIETLRAALAPDAAKVKP